MFSSEQAARIKQAAKDLRAMGRTLGPDYDSVDLACDTDNFFWYGLTDRKARAALRYLYMVRP